MIPSISCSRTSRQRDAPSALRTADFLRSSGAARQRQIRQVGARNQQEHGHAGQDHSGDGVGRFRVRELRRVRFQTPDADPPVALADRQASRRCPITAVSPSARASTTPRLRRPQTWTVDVRPVDQIASGRRTPASPAAIAVAGIQTDCAMNRSSPWNDSARHPDDLEGLAAQLDRCARRPPDRRASAAARSVPTAPRRGWRAPRPRSAAGGRARGTAASSRSSRPRPLRRTTVPPSGGRDGDREQCATRPTARSWIAARADREIRPRHRRHGAPVRHRDELLLLRHAERHPEEASGPPSRSRSRRRCPAPATRRRTAVKTGAMRNRRSARRKSRRTLLHGRGAYTARTL